MNPRYPDLEMMQKRQLAHDGSYSRDLMIMDLQDRMTHYTMHQGKYVARLYGFTPSMGPQYTFNRIVTDFYTVMLAMANALDISLVQAIGNKPPLPYTLVRTPQALGGSLICPQGHLAAALINYRTPPGSLSGKVAFLFNGGYKRNKAAKAEMKSVTLTFCRLLTGVTEGMNMPIEQLHAERIEQRAATNMFHPLNPAQQRLKAPL